MSAQFTIPKTQTAWFYKPGSNALHKRTIPVPTPPPGSVLLRIDAAGVCHSDLHILHGGIPYNSEFIPGHEIAGTVVALGSSVDPNQFPVGSRYAVHSQNACGLCGLCRSGHDNICQAKTRLQIGLGHPGGYEEYTALPIRNLIRIPDNVPTEVAAVATDAVLTPYHALKKANINGSTRLLVLGLGGLGINAVQIAKAWGAHVTAMDPRAEACELALKSGADAALQKFPPRSLNFDVVADFAGVKSSFEMAQKHVRHLGTILTVGMGANITEYQNTKMSYKEMTTIGSLGGTTQDLAECLEMISKGVIKPQIEENKLNDVNDVLHRLDKGQATARLVLKASL
ncbi:uncharacterized protein SAPINGB_P005097 [Magnusiomyces paraingens]|uniref:Enoyl reductase (ER) domain-containing protein n=1 Tax=Magnusiomyces paraingens TaxID=2606893 RepID=A0A5E8C3X1_9ASCO|nr:uncharacterized protein SAPINGB_P005097 [Saprochaete ingens]VVT56488.1 unnamed protein product [Saprochaete ingens]